MLEKHKESKLGYVLIALLLTAIGITFISANNSLKILGITAGSVLAVFGIIYAVVAISDRQRGFIFAMKIALAIICLTCGVVTAILNERAVEVFSAIFALLLIVDGSFKLNTSAMCRRFSVNAWWVLLIPAALTIAGSFWMIRYTPADPQTATVILGVIFIIDAIANILAIPYAAAYERKQEAEIYYGIYRKDLAKNPHSAAPVSHENNHEQ